MMFYEQKISKLLNVFFLWLLMTHKCSCDEEEPKCTYGYENRIKIASCPKDLGQVPSDLDRKIEGLYLNHSGIFEIDDSTFENTPNIKYLYLNSNGGIKISSHAFAPLKNLDTLDLSNNPDLVVSAIKFPESLKRLKIDMTYRAKITAISNLPRLESLSLKNCKLDKLPSFEGPPIRLMKIDLRGSVSKWDWENKLENFTLDSLASLCSLKELYISTSSIKDSCECLRLKRWIKDNNIGGPNVTCGSLKNGQTCDTSPSNTFSETYKSCELKRAVSASIGVISTICYILGGGFICIVLLIELYILCNRKNYSDNTIRAYLCCRKK